MWNYPQAQGTVTAVQLQTEAPVATATGQQVQTLQVVVWTLTLTRRLFVLHCQMWAHPACLAFTLNTLWSKSTSDLPWCRPSSMLPWYQLVRTHFENKFVSLEQNFRSGSWKICTPVFVCSACRAACCNHCTVCVTTRYSCLGCFWNVIITHRMLCVYVVLYGFE